MLTKVDDPDIVAPINIDISWVVTEYRAKVLVDENGNRFVASLPKGITNTVQLLAVGVSECSTIIDMAASR